MLKRSSVRVFPSDCSISSSTLSPKKKSLMKITKFVRKFSKYNKSNLDKKRFYKDPVRWSIYRENCILILFFVSKFIRKLKLGTETFRKKQLKAYHYHVIDDNAIVDESLIKVGFIEQLKKRIEEKIHFRSKKVGLMYLKIKLSNFFTTLYFNLNNS